MTTIAYRDGVLAADSLVATGQARTGTVVKIWKTEDGYLWGVTGKLAPLEACQKWSAGSREEAPPSKDEAVLICITPDGNVREWWGEGWMQVSAEFFAWGSGDDFAVGAMAMGADAAEAVSVGIRFDISSGGDIAILSLKA